MTGPYVDQACKLPADVPARSRTCSSTSTTASRRPALEFLSPIKGPNLEKITVEVGSGIKSGRRGRQALRRGREEAGPAAGSARLVIRVAGDGLALGIASCQCGRPVAPAGRPPPGEHLTRVFAR